MIYITYIGLHTAEAVVNVLGQHVIQGLSENAMKALCEISTDDLCILKAGCEAVSIVYMYVLIYT